MSTLYGTFISRGVEIDVTSECDVGWVDDSFSHEFGIERCGHAEVEDIDGVEIDGDLRERVVDELAARGHTLRNRRWKKYVRQLCRDIVREVNALDPDEFWTPKQLDSAVENWEPPEPDYDDYDD